MKIERESTGTLHLIESDDARTVRFESAVGEPLLQFLSSFSAVALGGDGYDVKRFKTARVTLRIETDDEPDYMQKLSP